MTYISLYRKWRSQDFSEIVGQRHIVQTLQNALKLNRLSHAYLFCGPRGTGKTSLARILAKALNCEKAPNPCGKCKSCEKIRDGNAVDVMEIDAASNRGIDEIRELREKIRYLPVEGRYKVYIIDEVHMLTQEAFNALLKTLEEPPEHVIFVLATTEASRVPVTISSRCQRLDFERIRVAEIKEHLLKIAKAEGVEVEDKAMDLIARAGEGAMRDSISLLDQLISYAGNKITQDNAAELLGGAGEEMLFSMSGAVINNDSKAALQAVREAIDSGKSALQIVRDLIGFFRNLMVVKLGAGDSLDLSRDYLDRLEKEAGKSSIERIKEVLKKLAQAETDMKWHSQARILFEVALIELLGGSQKTEKSVAQAEVPSEEPSDQRLMKVKKHWGEILESVKKKSLFGYVSLHEGHPLSVNEKNKLVINFKKGFAFHKDRLEEKVNKEAVEQSIKDITGEVLGIVCQVGGAAPPSISAETVAEIFEGELI